MLKTNQPYLRTKKRFKKRKKNNWKKINLKLISKILELTPKVQERKKNTLKSKSSSSKIFKNCNKTVNSIIKSA